MNDKKIDINKPRKKSSSNKKKILTDDDIMKYEIASELGLMDKVSELLWLLNLPNQAQKPYPLDQVLMLSHISLYHQNLV